MKIEEDNFKLLQHLGSIMTKKRVDNYWETEPPTFLRRVGIYHRTRTPSPCLISEPTSTPETTLRKSKCLACTPKPERIVLIPEERVPWELPKKILTQRQSKSATCSLLSDFEHRRVKKSHVKSQDLMQSKKSFKEKASNEKKINVLTETKSGLPSIRQTKNLARLEKPEQKIVLRQGSLQIVVNFPSFADVKIIRGKSEKYLQRNFCECRSLRSTN